MRLLNPYNCARRVLKTLLQVESRYGEEGMIVSGSTLNVASMNECVWISRRQVGIVVTLSSW